MQLVIDKRNLATPGSRVLHLAPERGIHDRLTAIPGLQYEAFDIDPDAFTFGSVQHMDLAEDCESLPSGAYDLVIHSHVMEHVACNFASVLFHLHRSLKDTGVHLFCVPILSGSYECHLGKLSDEERTRRFGQADHVRRFGAEDIQQTLGMVFPLPERYDLEESIEPALLDLYNIPVDARRGFSSSSVFAMGKEEFKLKL